MALMDWLFGRHLATKEEAHQRVGVLAGIPMLGLDALSSAAYGPEAALALLIPLGAAGVWYVGPLTGLIVLLLFVVYVSYRQTIPAYPLGGGSYTVARENLGTYAGLLAAAALLLDYVLTVAVGISAGVGALVSAVPQLQPYTLTCCLVILTLITLVNLRGTKESGLAFSLPTYLFIGSLVGVLGYGVIKAVMAEGSPQPVEPLPPKPEQTHHEMLWWLLLRAFASGCTAMTGVEAVSNGVAAFRQPSVKYAQRTLTAIIFILAVLLVGIAYLCMVYGIAAMPEDDEARKELLGPNVDYESVLAQLVAAVTGKGVVYYVTIGAVLAVLSLSANTGFADFPRLCRILAQDDFLPHGFSHRGRRLVYSQGIIVLAVVAGLLLIAFKGLTAHLIPLYAVGAFLAFTLSQAGMVAHWRKEGGKGAVVSMIINGLGAVCTGVTTVVVLVSKFVEGAWITAVLIAAVMVIFLLVHRHARRLVQQLSTSKPLDLGNIHPPVVVVLIRGWTMVANKAVRFAMKISPDVHALHVAADEAHAVDVREQWANHVVYPTQEAGVPTPRLVVIPDHYRRLYGPLLEYVNGLLRDNPGRTVAVIVPEVIELHWYSFLLRNQTATFVKGYLYFSGLERVVVINVPWYVSEENPGLNLTQPLPTIPGPPAGPASPS